MNKYLQDIRDQIICESWEKYKNQLSMDQLVLFFKDISLKSIYRIIQKVETKNKKKI